MLLTVPGMLVLVEYSNDEIRPMVATALPALDWFSGHDYGNASSTSEMHCRSQWSRSGLSECNHVAVDGHHLMSV